jgi:glucose-6-phosphate 1-epimerase
MSTPFSMKPMLQYKEEASMNVRIAGPTDRVYEKVALDTVIYIKDREIFSVSRHTFEDVVIWNPYVEGAASLADFEPKNAWKNMAR